MKKKENTMTVSELARKAVKARWKKTSKKKRKEISSMLHKAKAQKKLDSINKSKSKVK